MFENVTSPLTGLLTLFYQLQAPRSPVVIYTTCSTDWDRRILKLT